MKTSRGIVVLAAFLVTNGCGSGPRTPVSPTPPPTASPTPTPTPIALHDTLVADSSLVTGTHAVTRGREYSAPFDDFI